MPERVLTQRELNRALLARQLLLERARLPLTRALERVAGLQNQYAPSGYVGLWSRLDNFSRDDLTKALERRTAVQATLMRMTIHLVSARDYPLFRSATRDASREHWLKAHRGPRAPLLDPDTPAPVRFLPTWDATLLVHARRTGILPEQYRPQVFSTKTPQSMATFLVDGAVAGTWRPERGGIVTHAFARVPRETRREVDEEAERLADFHA
jgi:hypothetical protein